MERYNIYPLENKVLQKILKTIGKYVKCTNTNFSSDLFSEVMRMGTLGFSPKKKKINTANHLEGHAKN